MTTTDHWTGRLLIQETLFDRLVGRIVHDENMDRALATRIMDQALAFLAACATEDTVMAPGQRQDHLK